jgi:hypothetical protein
LDGWIELVEIELQRSPPDPNRTTSDQRPRNGDRNRAGGDRPADRNVISGNAFDGVLIETGVDNEIAGRATG